MSSVERTDLDFKISVALALTLSSGAPNALGLLGLSMKEKFQRLRLEKLEAVPEFCYLGDMLSAGGGCELAAITRCKCAWGKFRQLLPFLTNHHLPLLTRGKVYSSSVRSVMLHAAETWAMKVDTLNRLRHNDRAMIRGSAMSGQRTKLAQTSFSQSLASRT